jgi:SPX domain protein involved in polyphosphate accumulation
LSAFFGHNDGANVAQKRSVPNVHLHLPLMRYEFKYLVPNYELANLRGMLTPFMELDGFAARQPDGQYTVRSIYFDTPMLEMYHTKREHLANRMKVRLRSYGVGDEDSSVFFEIKRKYEGPILKNRATLPYKTVKRVFAGDPIEQFLPATDTATNIRRFFYQMYSRHLSPVVNVIYEREAYQSRVVDKENDFRMTLDLNLRSVPYPTVNELFVERDIRYVFADSFILEAKFNRVLPAWAKPIFSSLELSKGPASKYVLCMDSQPVIDVTRRYQGIFRC